MVPIGQVVGNDSYRMQQPIPEDDHYGDPAAIEQARKDEEREIIRKENRSLCFKILFFLVYLGVFTVSMLLESSDTSSRFADHIRALLEGGGPLHHTKMVLERIGHTDDVYSFLEQTFVPSLWENNTDTNQAMELSRYLHPVDASNRMIGPARVRQVRVSQDSGCQVDPMFENFDMACYPTFYPGNLIQSSNEATTSFGPDNKYKYVEDDKGTGYSGSMGVYPAGGYMEYLPTNRTTAELKIVELRENNYFGIQTRAVFIDFLLWNSNIGVYAVCRIAIEFGPTGSVVPFLEISILSEHMLKPGGHGNIKDWCAFFGVIIVMLFVVYFLAEEAQELYTEKLSYFMDGWNVLDWVNMLLLILAFIQRIMVYLDAAKGELGAKQLADDRSKDIFTSVRGIASKAELVRLLHSFNAVLLWGKCVKYFRHLPILKELVKTVWDAFALFVPLMSMFAIALIGFTMAYNVGFGDKIQELTTFTRAVVYLSRSFLRDVRLMPVYYITPIFGASLILLFYVMLVLVGVQLLFAVIADAMYRHKHHEAAYDEGMHEDEPLEEMMRDLKAVSLRMMKCCCPHRCYKYFKPKKERQEEKAKLIAAQREAAARHREEMAAHHGHDEKLALKDGQYHHDAMTESSYSMSSVQEKTWTTQEIMLAIRHMSGRVLSEMQEVGIEIRSELHDVCERVAQMQMAVEELSWRAELVRREQEPYLEKNM